MLRNGMFDIIRTSQMNDKVINNNYDDCGVCNTTIEKYVRVYDNERWIDINICKDCFCNIKSNRYSIPFHLLGENGYILDTIEEDYLYDKYMQYVWWENCYSCNKMIRIGVRANIYNDYWDKKSKYETLCEHCFKSQKYIGEELHVYDLKKKGLDIFNESKDKSK